MTQKPIRTIIKVALLTLFSFLACNRLEILNEKFIILEGQVLCCQNTPCPSTEIWITVGEDQGNSTNVTSNGKFSINLNSKWANKEAVVKIKFPKGVQRDDIMRSIRLPAKSEKMIISCEK